ncbi:hypothetical protein SAMN06265222_105179 [Neorhodopirellula lusitana]|uniref:Secreted protein n=1 Tax=Neorhodopirellula lusitana TaxID=445327 RepID=A0ABY1Q1Q0_9BACT|nr:hypothetical protein [Neorhodopirellula lusitana]SMP56633.1 hypothetical protein SAMN06265222_105179 [Neorhodopirellula lusitana]
MKRNHPRNEQAANRDQSDLIGLISAWRLLSYLVAAFVWGGAMNANVVVHADGVTDGSSESQLEYWIGRIDDAHYHSRDHAFENLVRLATQAESRERGKIVQELLRATLLADLETQFQIERIVDEIAHAVYREELDRLDSSHFSDDEAMWRVRPVVEEAWETFSLRAGRGAETLEVFTQLAEQAGPELDWSSIAKDHAGSRVPWNDEGPPQTLITHLGCVASQHPHLHQVESKIVFSHLDHFQSVDNILDKPRARTRVLARLVDTTLSRNPFGWSIKQRLYLALMYRRDHVANSIAMRTLSSECLPQDRVASLLTIHQLDKRGCLSSEFDQAASRRLLFLDAMGDQRIVATQSDELMGVIGRARKAVGPRPGGAANAKPPGKVRPGQPWPSSWPIRSRVQDAAVWVSCDSGGVDARQQGMELLQADPVWGVRPASLGFASQYERDRAIRMAKAEWDVSLPSQ